MIKESKGNMYEFVTHTWNPIKGKCSHGCTYCYMKKMCSRLNTPRLDAAELTCYLECSNFIFVGSSIDMWAEDIPSHWIKMVLDYLDRCRKMGVPKEFASGLILMHMELCQGMQTQNDLFMRLAYE